MNLNGVEYYYIYNGQGDIIGLFDNSGTQVVSYVYDTWGKLISTTGSLAATVGAKNPYRYRGYRYDTETGLYYLQSRYYNPEWGRFINADENIGKPGELLSHNLFAYCKNNPVKNYDPNGETTIAIGGSVNICLFGKLSLSGQFVLDFHGNVGFIVTPAVGFGLPNASVGTTLSITNADTIDDLKGLSFEGGASIPLGGLELVMGSGYYGCNISTGPGIAPFEAHAEFTYSILIKIGNLSAVKDKIMKEFKKIYDKLSTEQKETLEEKFGITSDSL